MDLFNYFRRETTEVNIGAVPLGGPNSIRIQSMTNTSTQDTQACVDQAKRIVDAGGEYVRLTTQGIKEAGNLMNINIGLRSQGYMVPLVADVHFNPKVADVAAQYAEKVRINPGNYVDAARTFKKLEYTDEEYAQELQKIHDRFVPFLNICKENHTAIRIGVNHGSLSDRIMSRYGDLWVEVDVGNQWNHISVPAQTGIDVHQVFCFFNALCCQTYIFTSGIYNTFSLCHAGFCILCGGVCHTLYAYRIGAAHRGGSNIYF